MNQHMPSALVRWPLHLLAAGVLWVSAQAQAQDADQARQWLRQGLAVQAEAAYAALIASAPNDPDHWLGRGLARARQSLWGPAAQDLERAVAISPGYADAWSALADVYRWSDRPAAAAEAYGRLALLRPADARVQVQRALSWLAAGEIRAARRALDQARALGAPESDLPDLPAEPARPSLRALLADAAMRVPVEAQAPGVRWAVSAGVSRTDLGARAAFDQRLSLRYYSDWGSLALAQLGLRNGGEHDRAWALDAYPRLWSGAYANVRYQKAGTPALYPGTAWRVELFQNLGDGWELAASHDRFGFGAPVRIDGVGVGYSWGHFHAGWRHQQVRADGSSGRGNRFVLRYYYEGDADHYLELHASQGRSDDFDTALLQTARSDARGLAWSHYVGRDWGIKLSARQARDSSGPGTRSNDVGVDVIARW